LAEISQAARDYLTALEKKRQVARARGGSAADEALVKTQTDRAKYLSGDDNKMQAVAQNRLRGSVVKKDGPSSKFDPKKDYAAKAKPQGPPTPQGYNQRAKTLREQGYKTNPKLMAELKRKKQEAGGSTATVSQGTRGPTATNRMEAANQYRNRNKKS